MESAARGGGSTGRRRDKGATGILYRLALTCLAATVFFTPVAVADFFTPTASAMNGTETVANTPKLKGAQQTDMTVVTYLILPARATHGKHPWVWKMFSLSCGAEAAAAHTLRHRERLQPQEATLQGL